MFYRTGYRKALVGALGLCALVAYVGAGALGRAQTTGETPQPAGDTVSSAPAEQPASSAPEQPPEAPVDERQAVTPSSIGLSFPADEVDFGGAMLVPGETYTQTLTPQVAARGNWTIRLEKDGEMTGETSGEVLPSSCVSIKVSADGGGVSYLAPPGCTVTDGVTLARGESPPGEGPVTVRVQVSVYVPWDLAPDVYRMTQVYSAFAI